MAGLRGPGPSPVLLSTKLRPPAAHDELVNRPQLVASLQEATARSITIVAAPTGFGKTTLLSQWLGGEDRATAWLSLEPADGDPVRLWLYVTEALGAIEPAITASVGPALRTGGQRVTGTALPLLLNELAVLDRQIALVLDDYHAITAQACHESLAFFVDRLPDTVRLVISTRSNPPFPLGRLRAAGELSEVRSHDLRFTQEEIHKLVATTAGVELDPGELRLLEERTEGWPAGCYLAALSLRDRADRTSFLLRFAGSNRHVVDYLGQEVLAVQEPGLRSFLLQSSILERLSAPICNEVLRRDDSRQLLTRLDDENLFLVALDEEGDYYRYHRLFAELLRFELAQEAPELLPELHRRAAVACEEAGALSEAVDHALAAGDRDLARDVVARHWLTLLRSSHHETVRMLLARIGPDAAEQDAGLALIAAWSAALAGEHEDLVERWLRAAERAPGSEPFPLGTASREIEIALIRASFLYGDVGRQRSCARQLMRMLDRLSPDDPAAGFRFLAHVALAYGLFMSGRAREALTQLDRSADEVREATGLRQAIVFAAALRSLVEDRLGHASAAEAAATVAAGLADEYGVNDQPVAGVVYTALGKVFARRGDLADAEALLEKAARLRERPSGNLGHVHTSLELALVLSERGERQRARGILGSARETLSSSADAGMLGELADDVGRTLDRRFARDTGDGELSDAELRVLRLLSTRLTQREIARELYLSLNTVKTHVRAIHRKLGVSSRLEAVSAARSLGLR